ncbi:hypothetical protein GF406_14265 [candidate division KSB1 bacterium]|nr:hypothetical protein [candidate division KSB1 bacterium]
MKNSCLLLMIALLSLPLSAETLRVIDCPGTPYKRGLAHGQQLRLEIVQMIDRWKKEINNQFQVPFEDVIDFLITRTHYEAQMNKWTPELIEEIQGIAHGSGLDYKTVFALQISEEIGNRASLVLNQRCTSIGQIPLPGKAAMVAQNMDPPLFLHGFPTLLRINDPETGLKQMIFTFPGFLGLNGLNDRGIAICCNGLSQLNSSDSGLPVVAVMRSVLNQNSLHNVRAWLEQIPHATPQCYLVGDPAGIECLECSANGLAKVPLWNNRHYVFHTNHPLVNRDFNARYIKLLAEYEKSIDDPYYCPRYEYLRQTLASQAVSLTDSLVLDLLSKREPEYHPVNNELTFGCTLVILTESPTLWIAPGRPDVTSFQKMRFE